MNQHIARKGINGEHLLSEVKYLARQFRIKAKGTRWRLVPHDDGRISLQVWDRENPAEFYSCAIW